MSTLNNTADIPDWLGTCATAAKVAAGLLDAVRDGSSPDPVAATMTAKAQLAQAVGELDEIISFGIDGNV